MLDNILNFINNNPFIIWFCFGFLVGFCLTSITINFVKKNVD